MVQKTRGHVIVIGGSQFGDEGKGKLVDQMSVYASIVARVNGADNAGHTVEVDGQTYVMHLLPSGLMHADLVSVIGNGVLVNPIQLLKEMYELRNAGKRIESDNLLISDKAFVIFPHHKFIDFIKDSTRQYPIGTTGSGVGPAYAGQIYRTGLRIEDLLDKDGMRHALLDEKEEFDNYARHFVEKLKRNKEEGKYKGTKLNDVTKFLDEKLPEYYDSESGLNIEKIVDEYFTMAKEIEPHITDTRSYALSVLENGKNIIAELAQGASLDKDNGTYPDVTGSNTGSTTVETGLGIPVSNVKEYHAVIKLSPSRVGEGPFVGEHGEYCDIRGKTRKELGMTRAQLSELRTKLNNGTATPFEIGQYFRNVGVNDDLSSGGEYGATTARPRRISALDLSLVEHNQEIFGFTHLALTKLDVYDGLNTIPVIVRGERKGTTETILFEGYDGTYGKTSFEELHPNAQKLVQFIREYLNRPISSIATGPARHQVITDYKN